MALRAERDLLDVLVTGGHGNGLACEERSDCGVAASSTDDLRLNRAVRTDPQDLAEVGTLEGAGAMHRVTTRACGSSAVVRERVTSRVVGHDATVQLHATDSGGDVAVVARIGDRRTEQHLGLGRVGRPGVGASACGVRPREAGGSGIVDRVAHVALLSGGRVAGMRRGNGVVGSGSAPLDVDVSVRTSLSDGREGEDEGGRQNHHYEGFLHVVLLVSRLVSRIVCHFDLTTFRDGMVAEDRVPTQPIEE